MVNMVFSCDLFGFNFTPIQTVCFGWFFTTFFIIYGNIIKDKWVVLSLSQRKKVCEGFLKLSKVGRLYIEGFNLKLNKLNEKKSIQLFIENVVATPCLPKDWIHTNWMALLCVSISVTFVEWYQVTHSSAKSKSIEENTKLKRQPVEWQVWKEGKKNDEWHYISV